MDSVSQQAGLQTAKPWGTWAALAAIMSIALVLRLYQLGAVTTWFDESLGWRMAQFTPIEIIERSERNVHPPAHFLLLHFWRALFGGALSTLRCYSLLWGMLTVLGGYFLARDATIDPARPADQTFGSLLASLMIALSPLHIHWSQQVKMYTLGTCLAVWSTWLLLTWFQREGFWRLVLYVPAGAVLALQHHYGAFTVFAQLTFALVWAANRSWGGARCLFPVVVTSWATTSLWSLWLPSFLNQRLLVKKTYWIQRFDWQTVVDVWAQLFAPTESGPSSSTWSWIAAELVFATLVLLFASRRPGIRWLGWLVLVPFTFAVGWSCLSHNVLVARFLIFAHVFLLIGGAVLIGCIRNQWLRIGLTSLAVVSLAWTADQQRLERQRQASHPGMRQLVETLRDIRADNEPVLVCNPMLYLNVCVHGQGLTEIYAFDPGHPFPHFQGTPVMTESEYYGIATLDQSGHTWVWTLDAENWLGGNWNVHLPSEWRVHDELRIQEWYGTLVLRGYRRST